VLRLVSFLAPAAFGIWHESSAPAWDSDLSALGVFAGAARFQGVVSTLLGQLAQALPLGSGHERAAVPGALALGVLGVTVFQLCSTLLASRAKAPRLNPLLAFAAAVTASLAGRSLGQGALLGSSALPAALSLATLLASGLLEPERRHRQSADFAHRSVLVAALLGLTALECVWAALPLVVCLLSGQFLRGLLPGKAQALLFGGTLGGVLALGLLPAALAPLLQGAAAAPLAASLSGVALDMSALKSTWSGDGSVEAARGVLELAPWLDAVGLYALVMALFGAVIAVSDRRLRAPLAACALLLASDLLLPRSSEHVLGAAGREVPHILALVGIALLGALGTQALAVLLGEIRFVGGRPAQALLVVFTLALAWAGAEDSAQRLAARNERATEAWTDEALAALPPRSLLVVRSEVVAYRLWAASALGARSDVLVVPLPLLGRGSLAADLLTLEPKLALLIRELSVSGLPSEQALTELSDARPLFVDVDPTWDKRLLDHLEPGVFFSRFAPHALGRSDREAALAAGLLPFDRVLEQARASVKPDMATLWMLERGALQQALLLEALGDKADAQKLRARVQTLPAPNASDEAPATGPLAQR
jgi:hypothetical protein